LAIPCAGKAPALVAEEGREKVFDMKSWLGSLSKLVLDDFLA
jgi:hypothetical protein